MGGLMIGRQVDVKVPLGGVVERISFEHSALVAVDDDPAVVAHDGMVTQLHRAGANPWNALVAALLLEARDDNNFPPRMRLALWSIDNGGAGR